ncbi:MAG: N-acetylmuramoyl-L-alanine amidase [Oscillospiraceae bacterium]|nr:N-acetylmuramoyl-L-alanine amidase [Oscillospiraceae bacterium]
MVKKRVSIEIGHGGLDSGAVCNGVLEKHINLVVGLELKRILEFHGVEVLINRVSDVGFKVADFLAKAKAFNPDAGISVHTNAFNGSAKGFEVFRNTNAYKITSNLLCANIESQVKKLGQTSRGVKDSPFMMSSLSCATAYCELGFLDNPNDYKQFDSEGKQKAFAAAYAKGILDYLGIEWRNENVIAESGAGNTAEFGAGSAGSESPQVLFRVVSGSFSKREDAVAHVGKLKDCGFDAFIV